MTHFDVLSTLAKDYRFPLSDNIREQIRGNFNTPVSPILIHESSNVVAIDAIAFAAEFPNMSFENAMDICKIRKKMDTMRVRREEPDSSLDEEEFMMLSADIISDLIDAEPDTGRLPEVKVKFI